MGLINIFNNIRNEDEVLSLNSQIMKQQRNNNEHQ